MADPKDLASKARNTLSQALEALQAGDDVPEKLLEIAAPIAKTMGVLHRVEKQGTGSAEEVDAALETVRSVLDSLQEIGQDHPSVDAAMEAVAGTLSKMFALSKALKQSAAAPAPKAEPAPAPKAEPAPAPKVEAKPAPKAEAAPAPKAEPAPAPKAEAKPAPKAEPAPAPKAEAKPAPKAAVEEAPRSRRGERKEDAPVPSQRTFSKEKERVAGTEGVPLPGDNAKQYDVELGAHSGSNFYKGLSGNDVIEHGGIFVATYQVPKVGVAITLRVHLPGDLEFDADAVVQWTRDARSGESEPGFGARVTRISPEGRQLCYRYARNREPIFYDDL